MELVDVNGKGVGKAIIGIFQGGGKVVLDWCVMFYRL